MKRRWIWFALAATGAAFVVTRLRRNAGDRPADLAELDPVTEASEESFPASDPPAHNATSGVGLAH